MIVVRNVFQLKFGKAREALAIVKENVAIQKRLATRAGVDATVRVLTDVTGPFYTIVMELSVPSLTAFEQNSPRFMSDPEWQANYQKLHAFVESGSREIFTVVAE
jgi:hypothetical protein